MPYEDQEIEIPQTTKALHLKEGKQPIELSGLVKVDECDDRKKRLNLKSLFSFSLTKIEVTRNPEMTKKMSTPTKPPTKKFGKK